MPPEFKPDSAPSSLHYILVFVRPLDSRLVQTWLESIQNAVWQRKKGKAIVQHKDEGIRANTLETKCVLAVIRNSSNVEGGLARAASAFDRPWVDQTHHSRRANKPLSLDLGCAGALRSMYPT